MHRALVGNLDEPNALLLVEIARQRDDAIDTIDHPFLGFAVLAVDGMNPGVTKSHRDPIERHSLALGVKAQRHRRAGPKAGKHEVVWTRTAVKAADINRLVGEKSVPAGPDLLLEASGAGFLHGHSGFARQVAPDINDVEIALGPGADHVGDIGGIAAPAQEVIGPGKRDEAFRMLRRSEDVGCIFDAHDVVGRRMEHQQGLGKAPIRSRNLC